MFKFASCVLLLSALAPAADLAGTWQFEQAGRGGGPARVTTFVFKVDGAKFTVTYATPSQAYSIVNGVVAGNQITFQTTDDYAIPPRITNYQGTLEGEQLSLAVVRPAQANSPEAAPPPSMTAIAMRSASTDQHAPAPRPPMRPIPSPPPGPEQAALDEAIAAAAQAGRGGRGGGGRGGPPAPMVLKRVGTGTVFHPTPALTRPHSS